MDGGRVDGIFQAGPRGPPDPRSSAPDKNAGAEKNPRRGEKRRGGEKMMLPVVTFRRRSAQAAGPQPLKQGSNTGSEPAERGRLLGKARLASAG